VTRLLNRAIGVVQLPKELVEIVEKSIGKLF